MIAAQSSGGRGRAAEGTGEAPAEARAEARAVAREMAKARRVATAPPAGAWAGVAAAEGVREEKDERGRRR